MRSGIEAFDKRRGWRGSVTNKILDNDWENKISEIILDPTLEWNKAEITNIENDYFDLQILDGDKVKIYKKDIRWALRKKEIEDVFQKGDFIFIKKEKNIWTLKQYPKVNGAIVVLDPFTGEVKALVGGFSYMSSEFNRVTQAKRQPGSAFKPFVYAAALENGLSPTSIILDAPFIAEQGIGLKDWKPENYGKKFYGPTTLRKGIEYSRNLMTVRYQEPWFG